MSFTIAQQRPSSRIVCLAIASVVVLLAACSKDESKDKAAEAVPVSVMEAKVEQVPFTLEVVGQTEGSREVEVRARVGGILMKRLYQEGAVVKAGQPLFEIDKAPYDIALAQAQGQRAEQKARAEQATREASRLKGLLNQRAISQKEFDDATSANAVAEAGMQSAEALVKQASLNLSYAVITAPVGGISGRSQHSEGALISTGADGLMTTIVQANPLWVRFGVADTELMKLRGASAKRRPISKVEAVFPDGSVYPRAGRINFESPDIDRQLGTVTLRAEFDNPDAAIAAGQFVRVRLSAGKRSAVLVPQSAASQTDRGTIVYLVGDDGKAQVRPIQTEGSSGTNWIVVSGLKGGEKIITDNLLKLKPGTPVKVDVSKDAAGAATPPSATPATKA